MLVLQIGFNNSFILLKVEGEPEFVNLKRAVAQESRQVTACQKSQNKSFKIIHVRCTLCCFFLFLSGLYVMIFNFTD